VLVQVISWLLVLIVVLQCVVQVNLACVLKNFILVAVPIDFCI